MIEAQYGANFFYEEAINHIFPDVYGRRIEELKLDVVSQPTIDVEKIDKETGVKFIVNVTVKPDITLGQYKRFGSRKEKIGSNRRRNRSRIKICTKKKMLDW